MCTLCFKMLYAACRDLFAAILAQFTREIAPQPKIAKKTLKPLFWRFKVIQGLSDSFKVIDVDTIQKLVISACYDKQHACA